MRKQSQQKPEHLPSTRQAFIEQQIEAAQKATDNYLPTVDEFGHRFPIVEPVNEYLTKDEAIKKCCKAIAEAHAQVGQKFSGGKLDWTLVDWSSLEGLVKRLMCGEKKYSRDNWKKVPNAVHEYRKALLRHIFKYLNDGADLEDKDDPLMEGTTHLDAAMCCLMFLKYFEGRKG